MGREGGGSEGKGGSGGGKGVDGGVGIEGEGLRVGHVVNGRNECMGGWWSCLGTCGIICVCRGICLDGMLGDMLGAWWSDGHAIRREVGIWW
jgi:hypothetical protein